MKSSKEAVAGVGGGSLLAGDFGDDDAIVLPQMHGTYMQVMR